MRNRIFFRYLLVFTLLAAASLSCNLVMNPINNAIGSVKTVQSVITEAVGIATQVDVGGLVTSVGSIITQVDIEGMTTAMGDLGGMLDNSTPDPSVLAKVPADIPVMQGATSVTATANNVQYSSDASVQDIANYYEREMLAKGWAKVEGKVDTNTATLVYQKAGHKATVVIEDFMGFSSDVTITIQ